MLIWLQYLSDADGCLYDTNCKSLQYRMQEKLFLNLNKHKFSWFFFFPPTSNKANKSSENEVFLKFNFFCVVFIRQLSVAVTGAADPFDPWECSYNIVMM